MSVSREEYDALPGINWSRLKHLGRSPAHYRHNLLVPREDTDALRLGRLTHLAALEPERFASDVAVWTGGRRAGKEWEAFKAKNAHREILTENELDDVFAVATAARKDPVASKYLSGGESEVSIQWKDAAMLLQCKARLDFVTPTALVDLKTTRDASPDGFGREVWRLRYHVQAAWYRDGYAAATGKALPYFLIAVEKDAPHVVQVYQVPEAILELGREEYRILLSRYIDCHKENAWPGYATGEMELTLPSWAVDRSEDNDLADLDLVISQ